MKYLIFLYFFFLCSCSNRDKSIVAEVNGYEISASELSRLTTQETFDLLNTAYEIKLKALDDLIKHKLIEQEAAAVGKTFNVFLDDYVKEMINGKEDSLLMMFGSVDEVSSIQEKGLAKCLQEVLKGIFL